MTQFSDMNMRHRAKENELSGAEAGIFERIQLLQWQVTCFRHR